MDKNKEQKKVASYKFSYICNVNPKMENGKIWEDEPYSRYKNKKRLPLHQHGSGNFCKFEVPKRIGEAGVYVISVDDNDEYVGECEHFSDRFNKGYGQISPRNCFKNGQSTNCYINKKILEACKNKQMVTVWFHKTDERKKIEKILLDVKKWEWNQK